MRIEKIAEADAINRGIYGERCPAKFQCLYVKPKDIFYEIDSQDADFQRAVLNTHEALPSKAAIRARARLRNGENVVLGGDWDMFLQPFKDNITRKRVFNKIQSNISWRDAGCYDWMERAVRRDGEVDGCKDVDDIKRRFEILDNIIKDCHQEIGLASQKDLCPTAFREFGGIAVAISRDGEIISASAGNHRLSIAQCFDLKWIPVCICAVHPLSIENGSWNKLRELSNIAVGP